MRETIERFCCRDDLSTSDPYDIWKTPLGYRAKRLFNRSRALGLLPAGVLACADLFLNNRLRLFYRCQEYAIVRALAAQSLLNLYERDRQAHYLHYTKLHLNWLVRHTCAGYSGACWGLGFPHAVSRGLEHDSNTPFSTMTCYPLEALVRYAAVTGDSRYTDSIKSVYRFFDQDLAVMSESPAELVTSYGPGRDRVVVNAVSYTMYAYSLLLAYLPETQQRVVRTKIGKQYAFIRRNQRKDGSWLYSPDGRSFIDCFHSCIVLKNLIKTNETVPLEGCEDLVRHGYGYLTRNFRDDRYGLFRRFTLSNKPSLVKFDLYDNAEVINVTKLMGDTALMSELVSATKQHFCNGTAIYSQIDLFGRRRNPDMLRWAIMPYVYALSTIT